MTYQRNEYPRPQFRRDRWQSLNGQWDFDFVEGEMLDIQMPLTKKINVPFSYQWEASGINDKAVHEQMLYRRSFCIDEENVGKRALLCFNAVDYECSVWVNGHLAMTHEGGFTPFHADITPYLTVGENTLAVYCKDTLDTTVPRGKQSWTGEQYTCFYYPNSGIWQSVWLEFFADDCVEQYSLQVDIDRKMIIGNIEMLYGLADELEMAVIFRDRIIKKQRVSVEGKSTAFSVCLDSETFGRMLWWVDDPKLVYVDLKLLKNGEVVDEAHTRLGLRKISVENGQIRLNNVPLYQRLVLDQGYWAQSGLTPPSAEALKKDIELAKAMGFNGARKHQKLEDPYFYYYADELGFLTWCEMPSAYTFCDREVMTITAQWQDIIHAAKNFASIIAYVPLNESWGTRDIRTDKRQQAFAKSLYYLTKSIDDTRIVSTNDGFENIEDSDILSIHDYDIKTTDEFSVKYNGNYDTMYPQGWPLFADGHHYLGQPVLFTEFGGIAFVSAQKGDAWGYGNGAKDEKELLERLKQLVDGILSTEFQGYCYTQLTDVQQEVNGLLYPDRTPKVDMQSLNMIFGRNKKLG